MLLFTGIVRQACRREANFQESVHTANLSHVSQLLIPHELHTIMALSLYVLFIQPDSHDNMRVSVSPIWCRVSGFGSGSRVPGLGFWVPSFGFLMLGFGFLFSGSQFGGRGGARGGG